jgi:hypothetical protein
MAKTADEARKAAMKAKRGLPKGGGKGLKGSNLYTPVRQSTIDKIKKMGMTRALAGAKDANAEMKQALTRMYGARRLAEAIKPMNTKPMQTSARVAERSTPMKAKLTAREAERRTPVAKKSTAPMARIASDSKTKFSSLDEARKAATRKTKYSNRVSRSNPRPRFTSLDEARRAAAKKNK